MQAGAPDTKDQPWRLVVLPAGLFGLILVLLMVGRAGGFGEPGALAALIEGLPAGPVGLGVTVGVFCLGAYLGAPQFALVAGAVVAFGPGTGAVFAWLATMVSGSTTFWTGRMAGERALRRYGGGRADAVSSLLGRNAFAASALVRNLPTAPFIIVNMTFGVSHARFWPFFFGMALGSIPKIALIAFFGQSVAAALAGSVPLAIGFGALVIGVWFALAVLSRRLMRRHGQDLPPEA